MTFLKVSVGNVSRQVELTPEVAALVDVRDLVAQRFDLSGHFDLLTCGCSAIDEHNLRHRQLETEADWQDFGEKRHHHPHLVVHVRRRSTMPTEDGTLDDVISCGTTDPTISWPSENGSNSSDERGRTRTRSDMGGDDMFKPTTESYARSSSRPASRAASRPASRAASRPPSRPSSRPASRPASRVSTRARSDSHAPSEVTVQPGIEVITDSETTTGTIKPERMGSDERIEEIHNHHHIYTPTTDAPPVMRLLTASLGLPHPPAFVESPAFTHHAGPPGGDTTEQGATDDCQTDNPTESASEQGDGDSSDDGGVAEVSVLRKTIARRSSPPSQSATHAGSRAHSRASSRKTARAGTPRERPPKDQSLSAKRARLLKRIDSRLAVDPELLSELRRIVRRYDDAEKQEHRKRMLAQSLPRAPPSITGRREPRTAMPPPHPPSLPPRRSRFASVKSNKGHVRAMPFPAMHGPSDDVYAHAPSPPPSQQPVSRSFLQPLHRHPLQPPSQQIHHRASLHREMPTYKQHKPMYRPAPPPPPPLPPRSHPQLHHGRLFESLDLAYQRSDRRVSPPAAAAAAASAARMGPRPVAPGQQRHMFDNGFAASVARVKQQQQQQQQQREMRVPMAPRRAPDQPRTVVSNNAMMSCAPPQVEKPPRPIRGYTRAVSDEEDHKRHVERREAALEKASRRRSMPELAMRDDLYARTTATTASRSSSRVLLNARLW